MSKNRLIILIFIVCILLIAIIIFNKKSNDNTEARSTNLDEKTSYDEETGLYYIQDEKNGAIIQASTDKVDLEFYRENPDYNPNPLAEKSTDLKEFMNYQDDGSDNTEILKSEN